MNNENVSGSLHASDSSIVEVLRAARQELDVLLRQRAEITRRIGTAKQAIIGLANLVGGSVLHESVLELMDLRTTHRQSGFTRACRYLLTEANRPMNSTELCGELLQKFAEVAARHRDLQASTTTVMNRLVAYGEAVPGKDKHGRRTWKWVAGEEPALDDVRGHVGQPQVPFVQSARRPGMDVV